MSHDERMIQAYIDGKDLYCEIASIAFDVPYEECLEFRPDGTTNAEGKKRRTTAKAIVLGVCYGKGIAAIAEDLHTSKQKASQIYHTIMEEFPGLRNFIDECKDMAYTYGYVDTIWGRKRRLPNMLLPRYEFTYVGSQDRNFDPLADDEEDEDDVLDPELVEYYTDALDHAWGFQKKNSIKQDALKDGLKIKDNTGLIAESERQAVNSRIQGSAGDMCKRAMNLIHNDPDMKKWGFRMLIPIHDEILGEAPARFAKQAGIRLTELMIKAAEGLSIPFKCDAVWMDHWNGEEYNEDNVDVLVNKLLNRS